MPKRTFEEGHVGHVGSQHVLDGGAARDEVEALEDHADLAAVAAKLLAAQESTSTPSTVSSPLEISCIRLMQRRIVDLPAPDRPMIATNSPLLDLKIDVLQRGEAVGIGLVNILEFYHAATLFSFNMDFSSY